MIVNSRILIFVIVKRTRASSHVSCAIEAIKLLLLLLLLLIIIKGGLAGHTVAMITYCVREMITKCSPRVGQFFDAMIVISIKC